MPELIEKLLEASRKKSVFQYRVRKERRENLAILNSYLCVLCGKFVFLDGGDFNNV